MIKSAAIALTLLAATPAAATTFVPSTSFWGFSGIQGSFDALGQLQFSFTLTPPPGDENASVIFGYQRLFDNQAKPLPQCFCAGGIGTFNGSNSTVFSATFALGLTGPVPRDWDVYVWDNVLDIREQGLPGFGETTLSITIAPGIASVPEPTTWLLLLIGFALLGRAGRSWKPRPALAARDCSHL